MNGTARRARALRRGIMLVLALLIVASCGPPSTPNAPTAAQPGLIAATATSAPATAAPVLPTDAPISTATTPAPTTAAPVLSTDTPISMTTTSAPTTAAPVLSTDTPISTTTTPASPTTTPVPGAAGNEVVLDGGVRISYTSNNVPGAALFRVDELAVYPSFALLRRDWANRAGSPTLVLALIETGSESNLWRLRYSSPLSSTMVITPDIPSGPATPIGWSEFTLFSSYSLDEPAGGESPLSFGPLSVDESPLQTITLAEPFTPTVGVAFVDVLSGLPTPNLVRRLLIREVIGERVRYTLAVVDPTIGAGIPPSRRWCGQQRFVSARRGVCRRIR